MSIHIKTHHSVALPIYNKTREELQVLTDLADADFADKDNCGKKRIRDTQDDDDDDNIEISRQATMDKDAKQNNVFISKSPLIKALKKQKKEAEKVAGNGKDRADVKGQKPTTTEATKEDEDEKKSLQIDSRKKVHGSKSSITSNSDGGAVSLPKDGDVSKGGTKLSVSKINAEGKKPPREKSIDKTAHVETKNQLDESKKDGEKMIVIGSTQKSKSSQESSTAIKRIPDRELLSVAKGGDSYISASKFVGAKKGYVFRKGPKGLGYYLDVLPKVDTIALKKIVRGRRG
jgi:hypothetical protein